MNQQFATDVRVGLTSSPKKISSKYFYDEKGSALFSEIMNLPEYYLTNSEFEIIQTQTREMVKLLGIEQEKYFELIEFGAGDGYKTIEFLKVLEEDNFTYQYIPIDISQKAIDQIEGAVDNHFTNLNIAGRKGDYFEVMEELKGSNTPKVLLFLGSNIGNMEDDFAHAFLSKLALNLNKGDFLILGTDLKKSTEIVLPAYNDSQGVTSQFNLNLLERMNRELGADFNIDLFEHFPEYDEKIGVARSSIRSKTNQTVYLQAIDLSVEFKEGEPIHTEISRKYDDEILTKIMKGTGFEIVGRFTDQREYFANYIMVKSE